MAREYSIKIVGWKKYQNREVKTKSSWLRFQNDFIENPNFSEFSPDERVVWIYALCCASKLNTEVLQVPLQCSHQVLNRCTGIIESAFHRAFEKLNKLKVVEIRTTRGRYSHDTSEIVGDTLRNVTERNEDETRRNETKYLSTRSASPSRGPVAELDKGVGQELLGGVTHKLQNAWLTTYPGADWLLEEMGKARIWIEANPKRAPKDLGRFLSTWFSNGYERYRKGIPSRRQTNSETNMQALGDLYRKVNEEEAS